VYHTFEDDKRNRAYMVMDSINGSNLEVLRKQQPHQRFSFAQSMGIMAPIVNAVSYLFKRLFVQIEDGKIMHGQGALNQPESGPSAYKSTSTESFRSANPWMMSVPKCIPHIWSLYPQ
jgi:hypothetical protein